MKYFDERNLMTVKAEKTKQRKGRSKRLISLLMAIVLTAGLLPMPAAMAENADKPKAEQDASVELMDAWYQPYIDKLAGWGVMQGDGNGNMRPDDSITRAEYVAMINRAYGYKIVAPTTFTDVHINDWFYDDIGIAYGAGYFNGKSDTEAYPNDTLTREEAAVIMARNMRLQPIAGESTSFTDGRELSSWAKGLVEAIAREGIISGYADGSFHPHSSITRAEMAAMLSRAVGTLIQTPGEESLGSVYGNLTINTSGVTLKDTVIAGDLYLTGGVGLGAVTLENVTVLGKIVVSGAGEANKGDSSVILRNTDARELIVDSIANNFVTVRTEGVGIIDRAEVRTRSFIEDVCPSDRGIKLLDVRGNEGVEIQLAGNIKEVVDYTPYSKLNLTQGRAEKVTIDEEAIGATMEIALGATVNTLNLDTGATITGKGDINRLNVNASGCIVEMLPDYITIRPGITAIIAGETMDTTTAMESSANPRILAGYPAVKDVAPTSATAVFQTNKKGTVYWALTAIADGSVTEEDLINPPVYGGAIIQSGHMEMPSSNTDQTIPLTGLLKDGSYYVSAVLVDNRDLRSPVKVAAFTTPDDSTPDFATEPKMIGITHQDASVTVMPTKSCQLYYAVLPKGAVAPTIPEFKAGSVSGNLGYGSMAVVKNTTSTFQVNNTPLEELTDYVLYLLLMDADGSKNSGIKAINFSTPDGTPPMFITRPEMTDVKKDSITFTTAVNEDATIYWVAVPMGEEFPVPQQGQTTVDYSSEYAKICVEKGMGSSMIVTSGNIKATGEKAVEMKLTKLEEATSYDIYYVAKDTAGNYSDKVEKLNESTLDNTPPTAECSFSRYSDTEGKIPLADSDIMVVFSENVMFKSDIEEERVSDSMYDMYKDTDQKTQLAKLLEKYVVLIDDNVTPQGTRVPTKEGTGAGQNAWVDYSQVEVRTKDSKLILNFPYNKAIKLASGGRYHFELSFISDTSNNKNMINPNPTNLSQFTVAFAQILLSSGLTVGDYSSKLPEKDGKTVNIDMSFSMTPVAASSVAGGMCYDMFLWADLPITYDLYFRLLNPNKSPVSDKTNQTDKDALSMFGKSDKLTIGTNGWIYLGEAKTNASQSKIAASVNELINRKLKSENESLGDKENSFPLNTLNDNYIYEFAIDITSIHGFADERTWSDNVEIGVRIPAGANYNVGSLATQVELNNGESYWDSDIAQGKVTSIGSNAQGGGEFSVSKQFRDTTVPTFYASYPTVEPGDQQANLNLQLDRTGTVYYVVAPVDIKLAADGTTKTYTYHYGTKFNDEDFKFEEIVDIGKYQPESTQIIQSQTILASPTSNDVARDALSGQQDGKIKSGVVNVSTSAQTVAITGLIPKQDYMVYLVTQGASPDFSEVYCFRFQTGNVVKPQITVTANGESVNITTSENSKDCYWILVPQILPSDFSVKLTKAGSFYQSSTVNEVDKPEAYKADHPNATGSDGEVCSLISALLNDNKNDTKYSTFDKHAGSNIRNTIQTLVQQGGQGSQGIKNFGYIEGPIEKNKTFSIDCTEGLKDENGNPDELSDAVTYYFIVIMTNSMGEEFSFKAVGNVHKTDSNPPRIVGTSGGFYGSGLDGDSTFDGALWWDLEKSQWGKVQFDGTFSVLFDEPVYLLLPDSNLEDHERRVTLDAAAMKKYAIIATHKGATVTFEPAKMSITIKCEKLHVGDTITFFNDGYICDAYNNTLPNGGRLILTFGIKDNGQIPEATFSWKYGNQTSN